MFLLTKGMEYWNMILDLLLSIFLLDEKKNWVIISKMLLQSQ